MVKGKGQVLRGYYPLPTLLENVYYLAKWNPREAILWMDEARSMIETEKDSENYNKRVDQINELLDSLEKKRYYNKKEFWGGYAPERAVYHF